MTTTLDLALRVHTEPAEVPETPLAPDNETPARTKPRHPTTLLVIDCETTTDRSQRLLFGWYRYVRVAWRNGRPTLTVAEEGIFHADDLAARDPAGLGVLAAFAAREVADVGAGFDKRVHFHGLADFLEQVLYKCAVKGDATIVGFNLSFDLARLALRVGPARARSRGKGLPLDRRFVGGFSLRLWEYVDAEGVRCEHPYRPRVCLKHSGPHRTLMAFTATADPETSHGGQMLDLRALAFALTDRGHSLASAGEAFGLERPKLAAPPHGVITDAYVAYARRDVEATAELFGALATEYGRHPIARQMTKVFSPASIGKGYLRAMGLRPVLERQPDFPPDVLGIGMHAYYGGRAEVHVRRLEVPVRYLDFRSMYPTVNALMGLWDLLTAERVEVDDATAEVRSLLASATPEAVLRPAFWRDLVGFALIEADDDVLPARAPYDGAGGFGIGVNRITSEPIWWTMADAVASALLTGRPPRVVRAIRLQGVGRQVGLRPVALRGTVAIDPTAGDFFVRVVEERVRTLARTDLPPVERDRLAPFLKVLANAASYGIYAEMNREAAIGTRTRVRVEGLDGSFETSVERPETAGEFYFGPVAAVITGAARLMLALLERLVNDAGGTWAFCDTDSMAIVANRDGTAVAGIRERVLPWAEAGAIRERFTALNPYDRTAVPGSILRLEDANVDAQGRERELTCFAISAKRYVLSAEA